MRIRRTALVAVVVLAGITLVDTGSRGASSTSPAGLPIYQFVDSGSGPLPWNALSLEHSINNTTMLGGPHAASNATAGVIAYRTNRGDLATYTQSTTAPAQWTDLSVSNRLPTPAADPIPFFDPSGNVDLIYVDSNGHVIVLSKNDPVSRLWHNVRGSSAWRPLATIDLSAFSGVVASNGLPSVLVSGLGATVAYRTVANGVEIVSLGWSAGYPVPFVVGAPGNVAGTTTPSTSPTTSTTTTTKPSVTTSSSTTTTTVKPTTTTTTGSSTTTSSTTTTVKPTTTTSTTTTIPTATAVASDPVVLAGAVATFAVATNHGDVIVYTNNGATLSSWSMLDVTTLTLAPKVAGTLAVGASPTSAYVAGLTSSGAVELFTSPISTATSATGHVAAISPPVWSALNVTTAATGAPPLSGSIFVNASSSQLTIAGQAANWGDLFALTNPTGSPVWSATDVSVTAGSAARTVGGVVTGLQVASTLTLYAAGVNSPPPQGVGVYAIPSAKWTQAITDGWPIISETGGLGTQSAPWVGFTSTKSVASSPDFLIGQSIYNAHKRVTWLSFWTASGPLANEAQSVANYYRHGVLSGAWVAGQIAQYRALGVGLKPDWVIFDPEGYPDNHSGLDAPGGSSAATIARYATYWKAMLSGWAAGITSVDPTLNAGVYASQSEYRNYGLATQSMPVFVAVAFGGGGPVPVPGASGSNIRGFISFSATCTPTSQLKSEESTLLNPPWAGQFNTLQFNAGVYCPPA